MATDRRTVIQALLASAALSPAVTSIADGKSRYLPSAEDEVRRQEAELRAWLASDRARSAAADNRAWALKKCRSNGLLELHSMFGATTALTSFLLASGTRRVLDGQSGAGWTSVRDSIELCMLWWRAMRAIAQKEKSSLAGLSFGMRYYDFSHATLLAMAMADRKTADWFAEAGLGMVVDGVAEASCRPTDKAFPQFMSSICAAWLGVQEPESRGTPEQELFELVGHPTDDAKFVALMPTLLDYHLWRSELGNPANPDDSYAISRLGVLPTPAYGIVALRRRNGVVAIPAVDHPLMRLNTWPPPADTFQPKDTLIAPVTRRVERLESGSY